MADTTKQYDPHPESRQETEAFLKQKRTIQREIKALRQSATLENKTLEPEAVRRAIRQGKGLVVKEFGTDVKYSLKQLRQFQSRMRAVDRQATKGWTAKTLIATSRPAPSFSNIVQVVSDDINKSRELTRPHLLSTRMSAQGGLTLNFSVRSSTGKGHYMTSVEIVDFERAMNNIGRRDDPKYAARMATAINGQIRCNCQCGRWNYWFRYKATVAGYIIQQYKETGFPKVRNARLHGTVCKHLIVSLVYLLRSAQVQEVVRQRMFRLSEKEGFGAFDTMKRRERTVTEGERRFLSGKHSKAKLDAANKKVVARQKQKLKEQLKEQRKAKAELAKIKQHQAAMRKAKAEHAAETKRRKKAEAELKKVLSEKDQANRDLIQNLRDESMTDKTIQRILNIDKKEFDRLVK